MKGCVILIYNVALYKNFKKCNFVPWWNRLLVFQCKLGRSCKSNIVLQHFLSQNCCGSYGFFRQNILQKMWLFQLLLLNVECCSIFESTRKHSSLDEIGMPRRGSHWLLIRPQILRSVKLNSFRFILLIFSLFVFLRERKKIFYIYVHIPSLTRFYLEVLRLTNS